MKWYENCLIKKFTKIYSTNSTKTDSDFPTKQHRVLKFISLLVKKRCLPFQSFNHFWNRHHTELYTFSLLTEKYGSCIKKYQSHIKQLISYSNGNEIMNTLKREAQKLEKIITIQSILNNIILGYIKIINEFFIHSKYNGT